MQRCLRTGREVRRDGLATESRNAHTPIGAESQDFPSAAGAKIDRLLTATAHRISQAIEITRGLAPRIEQVPLPCEAVWPE
jgi:hypothetical protein